MNAEFSALADRVIERLSRHKPVAATYQGIHQFDDRFALFNTEYLTAFAEENDDILRRLHRFKDADLSAAERLERDLLGGALEIASSEVRDLEYHTRSADIYISEIIRGLYILVERSHAPIEDRATQVLERLRGVWRVLREGMANLRNGRNVPKVWTENGISATEGTLEFIEGPLQAFIASVPSQALREDLLEAVPTARWAIRHFYDFLRLDMLASSKGRFAVGKEHFQLLLRHRHGVDKSPAEILAWGERLLAESRDAMMSFADQNGLMPLLRYDSSETRKAMPDNDRLLEVYRAAVERARAFVDDQGLVTLPTDDRLRVEWTPSHERHLAPTSICVAAAPFEELCETLILVTPADTSRQEDDFYHQLYGHVTPAVTARMVEDAYPGAHVHSAHVQRVAPRIPRFHRHGIAAAGWTTYAQELMSEHGYFATAAERLFALRERVLMALRVVVDVRMHCEEMTLDEAATLIADTLALDPLSAEREARRFTVGPTIGIAPAVGLLEILTLREEVKAKRGAKFNLAAFHNELLGCGHLPMPLVREMVLGGEAKPVAFGTASTRRAAAAVAAHGHPKAEKNGHTAKAAVEERAAEPTSAAGNGRAKAAAAAAKAATEKPAAKAAPRTAPPARASRAEKPKARARELSAKAKPAAKAAAKPAAKRTATAKAARTKPAPKARAKAQPKTKAAAKSASRGAAKGAKTKSRSR